MQSVNLQLPAKLASVAKLDEGNDVSRAAAKLIALEFVPRRQDFAGAGGRTLPDAD
jgi:hypothetical protein